MTYLRQFVVASKCLLVCVFLLIFFSCHSSQHNILKHLSYSQKRDLEEFFQHLLMEEGGAYTLFGKKPITAALLDPPKLGAEETLTNFFDLYNDEQRKHFIWKDRDLYSGLQTWNSIKHRISSKKFKIIKRPFVSPYFHDPKLESILLINLDELRHVLEKNQGDFEEILGKKIDIDVMLNDLENPNSSHWTTIFKHDALTGIVFGYGCVNAWLYHWKSLYANDQGEKGTYFRNVDLQTNIDDSSMCPIPQFGYIDDSAIQSYKSTQKHILHAYENADFLEATLKQFQ